MNFLLHQFHNFIPLPSQSRKTVLAINPILMILGCKLIPSQHDLNLITFLEMEGSNKEKF